MSRAIRVVLLGHEDGKTFATHPNWAVGKALGLRHWKRQGHEQDALVIGGCGMDMGFHLVYTLSQTLYGGRGPFTWKDGQSIPSAGGYPCLGKGTCHSSYHQGEHAVDYPEGLIHTDGYALRHQWL